MANQFYPESPGFKLSFSNINCNINLEDFGILALAVKIGKLFTNKGKNYSKFTHKS